MKTITLIIGFAILLVSCGGSASVENPELAALELKKDSLKELLSIVNQQITELDTIGKEEITLLVTSSMVQQKEFEHKIELQGTVETDQDVLINSEVAGVIRAIHVTEGQKVNKGQIIMTIDSDILQNNIEELETGLEMAEYMLNKQLSLNEKGLGTEIELEQAKNQKKSLEKRLATLNTQKGKSIVKAPFSGIVDEIFPNLGEMASPQFPLVRLVNNKKVRVTASVGESHLANVKKGTNVDILFPNFNNKTIASKISYIGNYIDPVNRTFKIQVGINNNSLLLPNQLAKVKITDFTLDSALVINSQALLQDPENNNFVYKMVENNGETGFYTLKKVYVKLIKSYNGESAISPIKNGVIINSDKIVLSGAKGITENDIVKVQ